MLNYIPAFYLMYINAVQLHIGVVLFVSQSTCTRSSVLTLCYFIKYLCFLICASWKPLIDANIHISPYIHAYDFSCCYRVNKPYLPIAAGDLSVRSAWFLVLFFAAVGLLIVTWNFGPFISSLYCLGLFLGTIYSVPPFRLKRYPVVAFLIIATVCFAIHFSLVSSRMYAYSYSF